MAPDPDAVSWINPRLEPGAVRQVLTGIPGKTGVVYTLDRATGEFLWARPTVTQNVISAIDGATGDVTENAEVVFSAEGQEVLACPTWIGGKDWEAGAYSPRTNTMYMPLRNACARMMATREGGMALYALAVRNQLAPGHDQLGTVHAISAETGATRWLHEQRSATMSLVATGGGLVFGGDVNGRFRAFDDETGEVLWEVNLGSAVTGFPITYAVDGRQYVAVSTGTAGTASGFIRLTPEISPSAGNNLFVFGSAVTPMASPPRPSIRRRIHQVVRVHEVESGVRAVGPLHWRRRRRVLGPACATRRFIGAQTRRRKRDVSPGPVEPTGIATSSVRASHASASRCSFGRRPFSLRNTRHVASATRLLPSTKGWFRHR